MTDSTLICAAASNAITAAEVAAEKAAEIYKQRAAGRLAVDAAEAVRDAWDVVSAVHKLVGEALRE